MSILFIDANAYLNLYGVSEVKDLLATLEKCRDHIFVTQQIVDEVNRIKLDKFIRLVNGYADFTPKIKVPDLLTDDDEALKQLRQKAAKVEGLSREIKSDFSGLILQAVASVSRSQDIISRSLRIVFEKAKGPTDPALSRRPRLIVIFRPVEVTSSRGQVLRASTSPPREGQPAGQIDAVPRGSTELGTTPRTGDGRRGGLDYLLGRRHLQPMLRDELEQKCGAAEMIHCFSTVSEGVNDFVRKNSIGEETLPSPEVLEEIRQEEETSSMQATQEVFRPAPPAFSVAATLRQRLSFVESHGATVPLHLFSLSIPPGLDCEPELHRIVHEFNRAAHGAGRKATHGGARTREQMRDAFLNLIRPILRDAIQRAEAIEARRTPS